MHFYDSLGLTRCISDWYWKTKFRVFFFHQVINFGVLVLAFIAGCFAQTPQPVVTPLPVPSSTPLPSSAASPYFNAFRPVYPQPFVGGPNVPPQFIGGPNVSPQFIGASNVPQRFVGGPNPYGTPYVPILQQNFDITPEGAYTFRWAYAMHAWPYLKGDSWKEAHSPSTQ